MAPQAEMDTDDNQDDEARQLVDEALPDEPFTAEPDDDDEEPDGDPAAAAEAQQRAKAGLPPTQQKKPGTWASKRRERGALIRTLREKAELSAREVAEAKAELARMNDRMRLFEQRAQAPAQQQQQQVPDQYASALADVEQGMAQELELMRAHDGSKGPYNMSRYNTLKRREQELIAARVAEQIIARQGGQRQQAGVPHPMQARYDALVADYPWMQQDAAARSRVGAYRRYLIDVEGRPDTLATDREAAAAIAAKFRLGSPAAARPTAADRERAAGMAGGSRFPVQAPAKRKPSLRGFDTRMLQGTGLPKNHLAKILSDEGVEQDE